MATAEQIADLRRLINEPDDVEPFTDAVLTVRIDADPDLKSLAAIIWREKAATFASLVDVKEGNSDRKLSQLYKQALEMASNFSAEVAVIATTTRVSRTRKIERQ